MNATRYLLAATLVVGISVPLSFAHAATVVTYSSKPTYTVTTVRTVPPYWGVYPARCCYSRVVVAGAVPPPVVVIPPAKPPVRAVYVAPPVTVYPKPRVVYTPAPYYYVP
jgi:hypothetical protein